jgi:transposase-like protein
MVPLHVQLVNSTLRRVIKRLHFPLEIMLVCVRWYAAYPLSLRNLEEMVAERGVLVDHATVHRWALKMLPVLAAMFRRRKLPVGKSWRVDETYVLVGGQWKYLYRAVDKFGQTADFLLTAHRDVAAARRFFERAIDLHDVPEKITIDKSGANTGRRARSGGRQRCGHRASAVQVLEQRRGAGSPSHQEANSADDGFQVFRVRGQDHRWHRAHAHGRRTRWEF